MFITDVRRSILPGAGMAGLLAAAPLHADHIGSSFGVDTAAPLITETAIPLQQGAWSLSMRIDYVDFDEFSDEELIEARRNDPEADLHSIDDLRRISLGLSYGMTEDLTIGVRLPYVERTNVLEPEEGHFHDGHFSAHDIIDHGDISGLGDAIFYGLYRWYQDEGLTISTLFGVKAPTGEDDEEGFESVYHYETKEREPYEPHHDDEDDGGGHHHAGRQVETHLQPGSDSWDGFAGLALQRPAGPFTLNASVLYTITTEGAQDTELGDTFAYNVALSYGTGERLAPCAGCAWNLFLELNGEWQDEENTESVDNPDSGGNVVFLTPGVRLVGSGGWSAVIAAGFPVADHLNGTQVEPDLRVTAGLNLLFGR
jgi:hypothetical protein